MTDPLNIPIGSKRRQSKRYMARVDKQIAARERLVRPVRMGRGLIEIPHPVGVWKICEACPSFRPGSCPNIRGCGGCGDGEYTIRIIVPCPQKRF